jgi:AraC-like DNA-binding protein
VTYSERRTAVPGVLLWQRDVGQEPRRTPILPDGCLDLLWDGHRLFVAGPDATARWYRSPVGASYVALRFSAGTGPALLGVPAHELRDQTMGLERLLPSRKARVLAERIAADPVAALEAWAVERFAARDVDPLGQRVLAMASTGTPVAAMADRLGLGARQLHRRCLPVFGYGPRRLARVLRLGRSLEAARAGAPLAQVAADCGYVDQAHLSREVRDLTGTTPTRLLQELVRG